MTPSDALLVATALHAGFQAVVTVVVYPALRDLAPEVWAAGHAAHTRRISVLVVPVYLLVLLGCGWWLYGGAATSWGGALAVGANALALASTAFAAAPTHGRLGREGPEPALVARLLLADRVRLLAVLGALVGALFA
ncbi:MAG TPA: hypothetical protein VFV40_07410 [Nocardioides sp.]|nr:hypothetical protein [Nocardioides sp.]